MFGFSTLLTSIIGAIALVGVVLGYNTWENYNIRRDAKEEVRAEARQRAMVLIEKRNDDNAEITNLDERNLCIELGGKWVSVENRCD